MTKITKVAFLIDFDSFPVINRLRNIVNSSGAVNGHDQLELETSNELSIIPVSSTPSARSTVLQPSTSGGVSRIGPSTSSVERGERYCLYPTLQRITRTPPRMLDLDSGSDFSGDEDLVELEQRQACESEIAENLEWIKEIILERLQGASLVDGEMQTDHVQWSYQFFDSSQEVIKTKSNAKTFFRLDLETVETFEQILHRELVAFVHRKRRLEKKKRKLLSNGENCFLPQDCNRLTCLSNALKNIMTDIEWVDESDPANTKYDNILYILHHLPSNEREVDSFTDGHVPVGKSLHQTLLRDALLPPAFLSVLRDKLKIKLNFVDISRIGSSNNSSSNNNHSSGRREETDEEELDDDGIRSVLTINKMLHLINANHEVLPTRHAIPLRCGTWHMVLKTAIEGAGNRAVRNEQKNLMFVPFVDNDKKHEREHREKKRLSAESGRIADKKKMDALRRSERRRERELTTIERIPGRTSTPVQGATARDPLLNEMSPTLKVATWLGNESLPPPSSAPDRNQQSSKFSEPAISVQSPGSRSLLTLPAPVPNRLPSSAISYMAPNPCQPVPRQAKPNTSPPNRYNVKRNLGAVFNAFSVQRGQGRVGTSQSTSRAYDNKSASAKTRSATTSPMRSNPSPAGHQKVMKSKRKLLMDDDVEENGEKAPNLKSSRPSQGGDAHLGSLGLGEASASGFKMNRPSATTPQNKRLKRLNNLSAEKTVVQESPQANQRPTRSRRVGGLMTVDSASFYSFGSHESKAWEISGKKLVAQRLQDSVEDSKGMLADLSTREIEMSYEDFEILPSSSPECGPESSKKKELEVENAVKYFHVQPPKQSQLALSAKAGAKNANHLCRKCSKACSTKEALLDHGYQHLRDKHKICLFCCNRLLREDETLYDHMRQQHTNKVVEFPCECPLCEISLENKNMLEVHFEYHHSLGIYEQKNTEQPVVSNQVPSFADNLICAWCDQTFPNLRKLSLHIKFTPRHGAA